MKALPFKTCHMYNQNRCKLQKEPFCDIVWLRKCHKYICNETPVYVQTNNEARNFKQNKCIYILMYRTIFGHQTDHFAWQQSVHYPLVFKFFFSWEPCVLFQYIAGSILFLVAIFKEYAGNDFPKLMFYHLPCRVHCCTLHPSSYPGSKNDLHSYQAVEATIPC